MTANSIVYKLGDKLWYSNYRLVSLDYIVLHFAFISNFNFPTFLLRRCLGLWWHNHQGGLWSLRIACSVIVSAFLKVLSIIGVNVVEIELVKDDLCR